MKYIHECSKCGYIKDCSDAIQRHPKPEEYANKLKSTCVGVRTFHTRYHTSKMLESYADNFKNIRGFHDPVTMNIVKVSEKAYTQLFGRL